VCGEVDYGWPDRGGFVGEFGDVFLSFEVCEGLGLSFHVGKRQEE
jgi:hypothetical protein